MHGSAGAMRADCSVNEESEMTTHTFEKHTACERDHCHICDGGLAFCTTCHGAEGSLPTECPGERMTERQQDDVHAARLDFIGGAWVNKDPHAEPDWLAPESHTAAACRVDDPTCESFQ